MSDTIKIDGLTLTLEEAHRLYRKLGGALADEFAGAPPDLSPRFLRTNDSTFPDRYIRLHAPTPENRAAFTAQRSASWPGHETGFLEREDGKLFAIHCDLSDYKFYVA